MTVNTLVRHKTLSVLGIGCVAKVLKTNLKVNFGMSDQPLECKSNELVPVDTSMCKTVTWNILRNRIPMDNSSTLNYAIVGNTLMHFVGIGWVPVRVIDESDLTVFPRVSSLRYRLSHH